jgi:hypothetical protein
MKHIHLPQWKLAAGGIATTIIGALLSVALGWIHTVNTKQNEHETKIAVIQSDQHSMKESLDDLKVGQRRVEDKLDKALERRK